MLRLNHLLLLLFITVSVSGQVVLEKAEHDFGMLLRTSQNWVDIPIENRTDKDAFIFRIELEKGFEAKFSAKKIMPGKTEYIRISYTPPEIGDFEFDLPIYTSSWSSPEYIRITGQSAFSESGIIPCPAFGETRPMRMVNFDVEVITTEGSPIEGADVVIESASGEKTSLKTDVYGQVSQGLVYGPYSIFIEKENQQFDTILQVNAINNFVSARLNYFEPNPIDNPVEEEYLVQDEDAFLNLKNDPESTEKNDRTEVYPDFSLADYKPNNLVFLVDVSTSMKQKGKLDLLKTSMIELLDLLRPIDRFALISYSTDTKVIIETSGNLDKASCIESIQSLEAGGNTAGAKALKKAREISLNQFMEEGNNEVFLATDGAFNEGVEKALKESRKMDRMDVKLSVLGIKCGPFTTKQMKELVSEGEGGFISVVSEDEAGHQLIDQVKKNSAYNKEDALK